MMKRTWLEISRTMGPFFSLNRALLVSNRLLPLVSMEMLGGFPEPGEPSSC